MIYPAENEKDLKEIPANVTRNLELIAVEHMDEVLAQARDATRTKKPRFRPDVR